MPHPIQRPIVSGDVFGRLTVICLVKGPRRGRFFLCKCRCGREITKYAGHLLNGSAVSCGCAHFIDPANTTHGMSHTPEYRAWENARARCQNPKNKKYSLYGGRGIRFCKRWQNSFQNFIADMGVKPDPSLTLERKNSNGNYTPENCHWASYETQNNNRSLNRHVLLMGRR